MLCLGLDQLQDSLLKNLQISKKFDITQNRKNQDMTDLERKTRNVVCEILILVGVPEQIAEDTVGEMTVEQLLTFLLLATEY